MSNSISPEKAIAEEQAVLSDIWQQAGLRYRHIGGINTRDDKIARLVLPILVRLATELGPLRQFILAHPFC